ncbi:MAG: hypothetical protein V3W19_01750, partial [Desulfatiglandales bacterium]
KKMRQKLRESEDEVNRFSQDNQLISIDMQTEKLLVRTQEIQDQILTLSEDKRELEGILNRLNRFIENPKGSGHDFYSTKTHTQYKSTNDILMGRLLKRDTLLKTYTSQHPEVVAISDEIIENARKMMILLKLQIADMGKRGIDLQKQLEKVDHKTRVLM